MNFWVLLYRIGWVAFAILVVIAVISLFVPQINQYREMRRRDAALQEEIRLKEEILRHLKDQQDRLRSDPRFIEKIAREEFGFARPGETVFRFVDEDRSTNRLDR